jgi:TRAP transporter TAXI family solute receptor
MMMKKTGKILTGLLFIVIFAFMVTACGGNNTNSAAPGDAEPNGADPGSAAADAGAGIHLSIGTAGSGGYFYPMGGAIANIINQQVEGAEASAEVTGGSAENVALVGANECQMGMANGNLVYAGYYGQDPYTEAYEDIRALFAIQPSVIQVTTLESTGIKSIADLKGKKVCLGPAGGGQIVLFAELISYYGMTLADMNAVYLAFTEGISDMLDGNCDAVVVMAAMPTSAIVELSAKSGSYRILGIDEAIIEQARAKSPYFLSYEIDGGTYTGFDEDILTIAASSVMMGRSDLPEEMAYQICKAVYDHLDVLVNTVDSAKSMSVETGWDVPIALHPGAERFFKEFGGLGDPLK